MPVMGWGPVAAATPWVHSTKVFSSKVSSGIEACWSPGELPPKRTQRMDLHSTRSALWWTQDVLPKCLLKEGLLLQL